jgi:splicing factor 3B subunit 4
MSYLGIVQEKNQDATIYIGELDAQVNESILWELFLQAGPVGKIFRFVKSNEKY